MFFPSSRNNTYSNCNTDTFFYVTLPTLIFSPLAQIQVLLNSDRLVGLVVKASASRAEDPGFKARLQRDFSRVELYQWLKIGTPVATLPGAWHYRLSAGNGWPGVSILWLDEMESLICNFYLRVAARKFVWADPSLRYTHKLLGR